MPSLHIFHDFLKLPHRRYQYLSEENIGALIRHTPLNHDRICGRNAPALSEKSYKGVHMITIRTACSDDIGSIVALEQHVWGKLGIPALTRNEIADWYEDQSPFFLVAVHEGMIRGYYFGKRVHFSMNEIDNFTDPHLATGKGFSRHTHAASGNSMYGISLLSTLQGAGRSLHTAIHDRLEELQIRYSIGFSRLSGFSEYLNNIGFRSSLPTDMNDAALWYAHAQAKKLGMRPWPHYPSRQLLELPYPNYVDPVLAFHVRGTTFGLAGIMRDYIVHDSQSRNYGAFIVSEFPHR
jgi:hypothetical protein